MTSRNRVWMAVTILVAAAACQSEPTHEGQVGAASHADLVEPVEVTFATNAFPPTLPDDSSHRDAWLQNDCLMCHQQGILGAPEVQHADMSHLLLEAQCRSCHVPSVSSGADLAAARAGE